MKELRDSLLGVEPLDLEAVLRQADSEMPELLPLRQFRVGETPLLRVIQRMMDAVRLEPPPETGGAGAPDRPWWTSMPAAYFAALLCHVGMRCLRLPGAPGRGTLPPHARRSAKVARALMRRLRLPFAVREHATALILNYRAPETLGGSAAPAEACMRLACRLDLRALWCLKRAELAARFGEDSALFERRLDAFRAQAETTGVFGRPPAPPVSAEQIAQGGTQDARHAHRVANALRYFRLRARPAQGQGQWLTERLARQCRSPQGRLNLLIGPAACGKSIWAEQNLRDTMIISSDRMRAELAGDSADQSQNYLVFQRCADRLREALKNGENVTFDATNYMEQLRDLPVRTARWSGAEIHSFFFDTSLLTAIKRNRCRGRRVPEHVIHRHFRLLTPPALYEADQHWVVDEQGVAELYWPVMPSEARSA